ncbi:hypothetical protein IFM89_000531 [Coptis chinensis]|uniref:Uncharacterized protein n=1 Tax=Coptis chinensis TaxID=261450 RepID=A0A835H0J7_9MAGN|nr:hypothetical protein IFM89_000531 [Coptis chinensis]
MTTTDMVSKSQKAKRLRTVYEKLSVEGFTSDQIETSLSALYVSNHSGFVVAASLHVSNHSGFVVAASLHLSFPHQKGETHISGASTSTSKNTKGPSIGVSEVLPKGYEKIYMHASLWQEHHSRMRNVIMLVVGDLLKERD